MIGIAAIGTYLPPHRVDNAARAGDAGKAVEFVTDKIGFHSLARKAPDETTIDLCAGAFADLEARHAFERSKIDCVILCTQNPDGGGLPHNSATLQAKLGLPRALAAFDIGLGCSGYVYGLSVARAFMEANGLRNGLLFTADPYSKIIAAGDWDTDLLFGDGASVTLLQESPAYTLRAGMFATDGSMGHSIAQKPDGSLQMLGSNVFKFCMTEVPAQIESYLAQQGVAKDEVDLFLLHQGSKFIIDNLTSRLGIAEEKVPFAATHTGNLVSSSIPFLLQPRLAEAAARPRRILLSGFGVGLSWASLLLEAFDA
jgi:3-oxoacyl-[acyl-carrier-protein] synthase-3